MATIYSVHEITGKIKNLLENGFGAITLKGEISNYRPSGAGHLYFTLKDEKAAIQAVLFKSRTHALGFEPKDGMTVLAEGTLSVYEQRGSYQIVIEKISIAGEGDILKMLEQRKRSLAAEGLFDADKKKPLPFFPEKIAVITSPTGAAIRDIINVVTRRNNKIGITVVPAIVQGEEAAPTLVKQLKIADMHRLGDVIIIGRGGGSLEDLLPFSDEALVRAVAACRTPVISAVGHEIDWALSDYAADVRAPTPSAAAELAVPRLDDIQYSIDTNREEITAALESRIEKMRLTVTAFTPESLEMRFRSILQPLLSRFDTAKEDILNGMKNRLTEAKHTLALTKSLLEGADPEAILKRGYSIVRDAETGKTVRSAQDVKTGAVLRIQPASGAISARVETASL